MTRTPHDQYAKQYLAGLLEPLGIPEVSREVAAEVRQVDIWFQPDTSRASDLQALGLLGEMVTTPCLIEPFRNSIQALDIHSCLSKLFSLQAEI